jgi:cellulose synthase/poly-beta-1,6-N-acetylglucosamine synthase-like glycosyltransferase
MRNVPHPSTRAASISSSVCGGPQGGSVEPVRPIRHAPLIRRERGWGVPGRHGDWYDAGSIVEDFEITLAMQQLGHRMISPPQLRVYTDVMRDCRSLWRQRIRWQQGYLRTLADYPLTHTWRAWIVQMWVYVAALAPPLAGALSMWAATTGTYSFSPVWMAIVPLFAAAEMWAARRGGRKAIAVAGLVLPMWGYAMWRNLVYYAAACRAVRSAKLAWH